MSIPKEMLDVGTIELDIGVASNLNQVIDTNDPQTRVPTVKSLDGFGKALDATKVLAT